MTTKTCTHCHEDKPADRKNFGSTPAGNLRGKCRACVRSAVKQHSKANPEMVKARNKRGGQTGYEIHKPILLKEQGGMCVYCFKAIDDSTSEVDHITPVIQGGSDDPSNLQALCIQCNREKHGKNHEQHMAWRAKNAKHLKTEDDPVYQQACKQFNVT